MAITLGPLGGSPSAQTIAPSERPRPQLLLAVEDTLDLTERYRIDPLLVSANRLTIGEIVKRCIETEEALKEQIESHTYTQYVKTVMHVGGYGDDADKLLIIEDVSRNRFVRDGQSKSVTLKHEHYILEDGKRRAWDEEDDPNSTVRIEYHDLEDLPFYLEDKDQYDFEILSREIAGDGVVYEVAFKPKSDFEIAPEGRIWVDTSTFQILREEFDFGDRVPLPLVIKSIGPLIRERERIGELWVWKRILARVDLKIGWMRFIEEKIPDTVEFVVLFSDHLVNEELPSGAGQSEDRAEP